MERLVAWPAGFRQVRLGRPVKAGAPAGIPLCHGRVGGCSQPGSGCGMPAPSPSFYRNQWAGHGNTWASSSGGNGQEHPAPNPCHSRCHHVPPTTESQRVAPAPAP